MLKIVPGGKELKSVTVFSDPNDSDVRESTGLPEEAEAETTAPPMDAATVADATAAPDGAAAITRLVTDTVQ